MRLKLMFDSRIPTTNVRCNLQAVGRYLSRLEEYGIQHEVLDIAGMTENEIFSIYLGAIVPSVMKKVGIRRVFGSRRQSAFLFGKQVPALLVYEDDVVVDVYPQIRRWAGRNEELTIEKFLEDLLKLTELSASELHMKEASRALAEGLPRLAILCCMFAIEAFIWRILWGRKDLELIWVDGKRHRISCVDFVYMYARKSKTDFANEEEFEKFKSSNQKLFDKLRTPDDFLVSRVVEIGIITGEESRAVKDLRIVRNFCSHFNPFEATLRRYREAVQRLGLSIQPFDKKSENEIASIALAKTKELLSVWRSRVSSSIKEP